MKNEKKIEKEQLQKTRIKRSKKKPRKRKILSDFAMILILLIIALMTISFLVKKGRVIEGGIYEVPEDSVEFLYDLTYEKNGEVVYEHQIFDRIFEIIDNAENFIVLDMFLYGTTDKPCYRNLTQELNEHLITKKRENPQIIIYFLTDNFNNLKRAENKEHFKELEENGIEIIYLPVNRYSNFLTDIISDAIKISTLKLNHRKILIADNGDKIVSLVTSGNPHDESSANSNIAVLIKEQIWEDIYKHEKIDAKIKDEKLESFLHEKLSKDNQTLFVQYLVDGGLMKSINREIGKAEKGDSIDLATFYLSDPETIKKLISASKRGVEIRIIFDTNEFFFGKKKDGTPNKPVAEKLINKGENITIRWYKPHGEQFHTKLLIIKNQTNNIIFAGSSNQANNEVIFYNLQSDLKLITKNNSKIAGDINNYFNRLWNNENGTYTSDFSEFRSRSTLKKLKYEFEQFAIKFI